MKPSGYALSTYLLFLKQIAASLPSFTHIHQLRQASLYLPDYLPQAQEMSEEEAANFNALWLKILVQGVDKEFQRAKEHALRKESALQSCYSPKQIEAMTIDQLSYLHGLIEDMANEFNTAIALYPELEALQITTTRLLDPDDPKVSPEFIDPEHCYRRCRATSQSWSLVLRALPGTINIYLIPANELLSTSLSETNARLISSLCLNVSAPIEDWEGDFFSISSGEKPLLMKQLFKELVLKSARQLSISLGQIEASNTDQELRAMEDLFLAKQNMAQKLLSRHEELTTAIARDLHDVVIAELLLLKRALANHDLHEEVTDSLEILSAHLREICYDLAPRDLEDWGLKTIIEDLLARVSKRTGMTFSFDYVEDLPQLALPVQLHIYRIIQECLNNIAKYANATKIEVSFTLNHGRLLITIADNGTGFEPGADNSRSASERGMGLSTINERIEMIRCFHPSKLSIKSDPGLGTIIHLEVSIFEA